MTYVKTNWVTGDVITAEKLNKIEDGIASGSSYSDVLKALIEGQSGVTIDIPEGTTNIGRYDEEEETTLSLFYENRQVEHVNIPESVTSIGDWAFYDCTSLTEITLPEGITSIGDGTFSSCGSLTSITFPEGLTNIGDEAFSGCGSLTSITFPEGLTSIGTETFTLCTSLTAITLPESLTSIGGWAFSSCTSLASVTVLSEIPPTLGEDAFTGTSENLKIYVPSSVVNTYKQASGWSRYADKIFSIE